MSDLNDKLRQAVSKISGSPPPLCMIHRLLFLRGLGDGEGIVTVATDSPSLLGEVSALSLEYEAGILDDDSKTADPGFYLWEGTITVVLELFFDEDGKGVGLASKFAGTCDDPVPRDEECDDSNSRREYKGTVRRITDESELLVLMKMRPTENPLPNPRKPEGF